MSGETTIVVVGEVCTDKFVYGRCERICPEAPVPVLNPEREVTNIGMAGNVARNLSSLGVHVSQFDNGLQRPTKTRYVDEPSGQQVLRVDQDDWVPAFGSQLDRLRKDLEWIKPDAIVISDYDKGFLTIDDMRAISNLHPLVFLDTKKPLGKWCCDEESFTFVKVNEAEVNKSYKANGFCLESAPNVICTLGSGGCTYLGRTYSVKKVDVREVSGAGDTFLAALAAHYCKHRNKHRAIKFANLCSAYVVTKRGVTSTFPPSIVKKLEK